MATFNPIRDTYILFYKNIGKDEFSSYTLLKANSKTEVSASEDTIGAFTSLSTFNTALSNVGEAALSDDPFTSDITEAQVGFSVVEPK